MTRKMTRERTSRERVEEMQLPKALGRKNETRLAGVRFSEALRWRPLILQAGADEAI